MHPVEVNDSKRPHARAEFDQVWLFIYNNTSLTYLEFLMLVKKNIYNVNLS